MTSMPMTTMPMTTMAPTTLNHLSGLRRSVLDSGALRRSLGGLGGYPGTFGGYPSVGYPGAYPRTLGGYPGAYPGTLGGYPGAYPGMMSRGYPGVGYPGAYAGAYPGTLGGYPGYNRGYPGYGARLPARPVEAPTPVNDDETEWWFSILNYRVFSLKLTFAFFGILIFYNFSNSNFY